MVHVGGKSVHIRLGLFLSHSVPDRNTYFCTSCSYHSFEEFIVSNNDDVNFFERSFSRLLDVFNDGIESNYNALSLTC